jgi:PAS domain S-box-containing protein
MEGKRLEEEQPEAEARFRIFVDHASDALFVRHDAGKIVDLNRQACDSLGHARGDLIGKSLRDVDAALDSTGEREFLIRPR